MSSEPATIHCFRGTNLPARTGWSETSNDLCSAAGAGGRRLGVAGLTITWRGGVSRRRDPPPYAGVSLT